MNTSSDILSRKRTFAQALGKRFYQIQKELGSRLFSLRFRILFKEALELCFIYLLSDPRDKGDTPVLRCQWPQPTGDSLPPEVLGAGCRPKLAARPSAAERTGSAILWECSRPLRSGCQ